MGRNAVEAPTQADRDEKRPSGKHDANMAAEGAEDRPDDHPQVDPGNDRATISTSPRAYL